MKNIQLKKTFIFLSVVLSVNMTTCMYNKKFNHSKKMRKRRVGYKIKNRNMEKSLKRKIVKQNKTIQENNPTKFFQYKKQLKKNFKQLKMLEEKKGNSKIFEINVSSGFAEKVLFGAVLANAFGKTNQCSYPDKCYANKCCEFISTDEYSLLKCWPDDDCKKNFLSGESFSSPYISSFCDGYCKGGECCTYPENNGGFNIPRCVKSDACSGVLLAKFVPELNQTLPIYPQVKKNEISPTLAVCSMSAVIGVSALLSGPFLWSLVGCLGYHELQKYRKAIKQKNYDIEENRDNVRSFNVTGDEGSFSFSSVTSSNSSSELSTTDEGTSYSSDSYSN